MRKIDSDVFNELVLNEIENMQKKVNNEIAPDNVDYFSSDRIDVNNNDYTFDDNTIVNSMQMGTIKNLIKYLKINSLETRTLTATMYSDDLAIAANKALPLAFLRTSFKIPEGFDGRQSFPSISGITTSVAEYMNKLAAAGADEGKVGLKIIQNGTKVDFIFELKGVDSGDIPSEDLELSLFLWRTK